MIDGDEIHIIWCVDDVLMTVPRLTKDQAREVLHEAYHKHDAEYGIAWLTFEIYADMMFPKEVVKMNEQERFQERMKADGKILILWPESQCIMEHPEAELEYDIDAHGERAYWIAPHVWAQYKDSYYEEEEK